MKTCSKCIICKNRNYEHNGSFIINCLITNKNYSPFGEEDDFDCEHFKKCSYLNRFYLGQTDGFDFLCNGDCINCNLNKRKRKKQ